MTIIKNGTVVTADLSYKADVRIEGGKIAEIGQNLSGSPVLDATGCYVMPGGIDPHTHLEMPFMGTYSTDDFECGTRAALAGGTTMVVDFCLPGPNQSLLEALQMWDNKTSKASLRLLVPHGDHLVGQAGVGGDGAGRRPRHHQLQALHGLQGLADGERRRDVRLVPALRRARRAAARPCRERRRRCRDDAEAAGRGQQRPRGPRLFAAAGGRGRGDQPRHHDRRHGGRAALCRAHLLRAGARSDPPGAHQGHAGLRRAADPAPDPRRERILQQGLGLRGAARDEPALPQQAAPGFALGRAAVGLAAGGGDRPLRLHHRAEAQWHRQFRQDPERHRRARGPHAAAVDLWRQHRPADAERVRRGDLDQHRQDPQHVPEEGRGAGRRRRRPRGLGPQQGKDHRRQIAAVDHRLQCVRGLRGERPAALHADARQGRDQ